MNYSQWNLVVQHPNFDNLTESFSFKYKGLTPYDGLSKYSHYKFIKWITCQVLIGFMVPNGPLLGNLMLLQMILPCYGDLSSTMIISVKLGLLETCNQSCYFRRTNHLLLLIKDLLSHAEYTLMAITVWCLRQMLTHGFQMLVRDLYSHCYNPPWLYWLPLLSYWHMLSEAMLLSRFMLDRLSDALSPLLTSWSRCYLRWKLHNFVQVRHTSLLDWAFIVYWSVENQSLKPFCLGYRLFYTYYTFYNIIFLFLLGYVLETSISVL